MRGAICLSVALGVAAAAFSGCSSEVAGGSVDGKAIYSEACGRCHGDGGRPSEQMRSSLGVKDLTDQAFRATANLAGVAERIRSGSESKVMPAFGSVLTAEQIDAVAAYVMTLPVAE